MKLKNILLVIAILAVLSGVSLVLNRKKPPADEADPRVNQPLISADTINKAAGLRLTEDGKTVLLKKSGDTWSVSSYHDLPADFSKLARFVQDLANTKVDRFVTSNPKRLEGLEFKDTKVALLDASDHPLVEITLGKNAEGGGRFLRYGDESKAYLAPLNAWIDTDAKSWADSALTSFKADDIARVSLTFPDGGQIALTRPKTGAPFAPAALPAGQQLKTSTVDGLLSSLGGLRFTDTSELSDPKAEAARAHASTAMFTTFDGKTITVALGREPERVVPVDPAPKPDPAAVIGPIPAKGGVVAEGPAKVVGGPVTQTIPAGPVFAVVTTSDATDAVNAAMKKRAFQVADSVFTGLPSRPDDFFEPAPKSEPSAQPAAEAKPAGKP